MTTIAYDGHTLAVDSMASKGDLMSSRACQKMFKNVGQFQCVAFAGDTAHYAPIKDWLGMDNPEPSSWNESWNAVAWAVTQEGEVHRYTSGYPEIVNEIDADGSGSELALGALAVGATAEDAIRIASHFDFHTGGEIFTHEIKKRLTVVK